MTTYPTEKSQRGRVFIVQMPHKWDEDERKLVPMFEVGHAGIYGHLRYLLTPKAAPFTPEPVIAELREKLADFSDEDFLVLIGNPALIGFAVAIAADANEGRVHLLQWNGTQKTYIPIKATLFEENNDGT